jgi:hypothetical protein
MLVTPTQESGWRVNIEALAAYLVSRWPAITLTRGASPQRQHVWTWSDGQEAWIPSDRQCAWIRADVERVSAVAWWLSRDGDQTLVLCDEGYNDVLDLGSTSEEQIRSWLSQTG